MDGLFGQDGGEFLTPDAVLEAEGAHHLVYPGLVHAAEELSVLLEHRLGEKDVAHEKLYLALGPERERVVVGVLFGEEPLKRLHDVPDLGVRAAPGVDT